VLFLERLRHAEESELMKELERLLLKHEKSLLGEGEKGRGTA
jgi:hypothetical protein